MRKNVIIAGVALVVGLGVGYWAADIGPSDKAETASGPKEREILYWVAPMDPNYRRDKPGKSAMGMDLIPVYADEAAGGDMENTLQISAAVVNNIGVRTAAAEVSNLNREIDTVGFVTINEANTAHVHVRTAGWIEQLNKKAVGERVEKGEAIFKLYSPDLVAAQSEYLQVLGLGNASVARAAASRLRSLGMTEAEISALKKRGKPSEKVDIFAPQDGVIMGLTVGEGMYVRPEKTVFSLADLSSVWVMVEVYEAQSGWVTTGQQATMELPYAPGEVWTGTVDYVYPAVDPKSRTVQVRLAFDNADGRLKPNMYGEISIAATPLENTLSVPREALIRTGKTDRVILALGEGRFRPAEVVAGVEIGDRVVILDGLAAGETVVTSGQFLIDSESSLNGAFLRMLDKDTGMAMDQAGEPEVEIHHGMGTVKAINADGTVTLAHDPIESLGWPAMTMDFKVSSDVDLSVFDVGDRMHFMITESGDGPFIITTAMKM